MTQVEGVRAASVVCYVVDPQPEALVGVVARRERDRGRTLGGGAATPVSQDVVVEGVLGAGLQGVVLLAAKVSSLPLVPTALSNTVPEEKLTLSVELLNTRL
jgi:hypothetical protein